MPTKVYSTKSSLNSKKSRVALALAVSLWLGGAGLYAPVAWADGDNKTVTVGSGEYPSYVYNGRKDNSSLADEGIKTDFHTVVNGGKVRFGTFGGYSNNNYVFQNKVTLINASCEGEVTGGVSDSGTSTYNEVNITGSIVSLGPICGGRGRSGADHNTVTVTNSTLKGNTTVYGGRIITSGNCTNNTVSLTDSIIYGQVFGGARGIDNITGNTLNLYGVNRLDKSIDQDVRNFETINIKSAKWGSPVLKINGTISNYTAAPPTISTEELAFIEPWHVAAGQSTKLIEAANGINANYMPVSNFGQEYTIDSSKVATFVTGVSMNGTLKGNIALSADNKALSFTSTTNQATKLTFGTMAWQENGTLLDYATTGVKAVFDDATVIDASGLVVTGLGTTTENPMGKSMTLLAGATNITGNHITQATTPSTMVVNYTDAAGIKFAARASGAVGVADNDVKYSINKVETASVDLSGWTGTTSAVAEGWTAPAGGVAVTAAGFIAPTIAAGASMNILTATTDNFFSDNQITGAMKYKADTPSQDEAAGVTFTGAESKGVKASTDGKALVYARSNFNVSDISMGEMEWNTGRTTPAKGYDFAEGVTVDASNLSFTFTDTDKAALTKGSQMTLLDDAANLAGKTVTGKDHTQTVDYSTANGVALSGTLKGTVSTTADTVKYKAYSMTLDKVNLSGWTGTTSAVSEGWTAPDGGVAVTAAGFAEPVLNAGESKDILTVGGADFFGTVTGDKAYKEGAFADDTAKGVTFSGTKYGGVKKSDDGKKLTYYAETMGTTKIGLGAMNWIDGRTAGKGYVFNNVTEIDGSNLSFANPETIPVGSATLLTGNNTLADTAATTKNLSYSANPLAGLQLDGMVQGSYQATGGNIVYTATANQATKLTFGDVEWQEAGALLDHAATLSNVSFNGADVDTTAINFTNIQELEANQKMTLVASFGDKVGTISGTKYKVGSTLEGEGKASLAGEDLIFTAETSTEKMQSQAQTHNTVMGAEVSMVALSAGNDFVGAATEGLAMAENIGVDGLGIYANMGGGSIRQETGSHVNAHTWNAILAVGHKNEKKLSTTEYGAFFEYGRGNYSTFNGDERGDGSTRYTGGGILGKWQKNNGFYVEGSLRMGSIHDDASNLLRDKDRNPYGYNTNATYWGAHVGVGKEIKLNKTDNLDLYAKYFYNRRGSVSFEAGGHYDLDAVESSVLRIGTRYTVKKNDNFRFYGGLAVEHEFCGRAAGLADGVAIRGADIGGTSVRGEIGATFKPGEKSNVTLDLNLSGFVGKKRGLFGGVSVAWHF